ncbi:hypothetical protein FKR81_33370 [Lentzea tibetensis]|uniref:Transmembrane protein n=1 Tax=Lentzea tibetensis TaxID=2591470 RepID=A0A563EJC0_9PSEU|nr:hypothetical protein [Lentzea tibetensis]TWP46950.1 hypothetical protein FKR81_33370 [Lentzea tibetensis]
MRRVASTVVGSLGWTIGVMGLVMGRPLSSDWALPAALMAAGSVLVWLGVRDRRVGWAGLVAWGVLVLAGVFGSLLVSTEKIACMYCYHETRGYPYSGLEASFVDADMPTLQRAHEIMAANPDVVNHRVDWVALVGNAVFWGCWALFLVVVTTQVSRMFRARTKAAVPENQP